MSSHSLLVNFRSVLGVTKAVPYLRKQFPPLTSKTRERKHNCRQARFGQTVTEEYIRGGPVRVISFAKSSDYAALLMLRKGCRMLLLLLLVMLRLLLRHDHALLVGLVALGDGTGGGAGDDLLVMLDDGTARAPVGSAAVGGTVALDAVALPDLGPLEHGVTLMGRTTLVKV